ncbi:HNH endonuclease [Candidatus Parcubacteria bacterium]|nr:HNH endonuclease [Candidatus Parcubacteria bacterium]
MKPNSIWIAIAFIVFALAGYHLGQEGIEPQLLKGVIVDEPLVLRERTKEYDCVLEGALPDPDCTPGAIFEEATKEQICVSGYTKTVRKVSQSLKKKVYREYGIAYPPPTGSYEADHFIPLALGGNNDIANLFPEAAEPRPGFKEKDVVEVYLHEKVCDGSIPLAAAQQAISKNWVSVYENINSLERERIKQKYPSWSN